ncbi:MAG TPA: sigma 54-interacting transcriptional regulator [Planctomycetota bacterium]|nr:sigma 54-interacting transcriptional regulator [Planctomycetota bacterium]
MAHLTILTGPTRGRIVELNLAPCRIGRDAHLEIPINDTKASRLHVEIVFKDGSYVMRDMKSKNGTLVNGTSVTALKLQEGDQIQIGETRLAFSLQDAPAQRTEGRNFDSVMATRLPLGVVPALGTAGLTDKNTAESFETIELSAPLNLLNDEPPPIVVEEDAPSKPGEIDVDTTPVPQKAPKIEPAVRSADFVERSMRSLRALYGLARSAAEADSSIELLQALTDGLQTALEADRVTAVTLDEKGSWDVSDLRSARPDEKKSKTAGFSKVPVSRTIVDYAIRTKRSVLTAPRSDARFGNAKSIGEQGISSAMCVPILAREQLLGLLYADRLGGQDFVREDQELLTAACLQAAPALANLRRLEEALCKKERLLKELKNQHNLLGESPRMKEVAAFIERSAPTNSVVLILGESGTGKELVARAIHYNSRRSDAAFIIVNCAALTESLIESELFGHARGAFTGATGDRAGRFEMAHEGTIFLDEIGELSNSCQTKLLRVLEQGELSRVGEGRVRKVDVRVIAATNRELASEVKAGRFREDLFYRLNVLSISLPPLRQRGEDVKLLLKHYLKDAAVRGGRTKMEFSDDALEALMAYRWPGNVRELRNLTERLAVLCPNEMIGLPDLPPECRTACTEQPQQPAETTVAVMSGAVPAQPSAAAGSRSLALADMEKEHILRVLESCENNKKLAAEKLGIDRSTLYAKLRAYGLS